MPGSLPVFDTAVEQVCAWMAPATALDIGPGSGKFGRLLARAAPGCVRNAVELERSYIDRFALRSIYHDVAVADASAWWRQLPVSRFDLVTLGDVLEHMPKSAGLDLLNALVYRCAWLLVVVPEFVLQDAVDGVASEAHVSVWSERDFDWHDLWAWDNCRTMTLLLLRGYLPSPLSLAQLVDRVAGADLPVHDFDGRSFVRALRLRMIEHPREVAYRPG